MRWFAFLGCYFKEGKAEMWKDKASSGHQHEAEGSGGRGAAFLFPAPQVVQSRVLLGAERQVSRTPHPFTFPPGQYTELTVQRTFMAIAAR